MLSGLARGDTLYFDWQWGACSGRGVLRATDGGAAFAGTWGYGDSREDAGELRAHHQEAR